MLEKNCWLLKQCIQQRPFLFGSALLSLLLYCTYLMYQADYISAVDFSSLRFPQQQPGVWEYHAPEGDYRGRIEKSSIMVKKHVANHKARSQNLTVQSAVQDGMQGVGRRAPPAPSENRVKVIVYTEKPIATPILSAAFSLLEHVRYIHEPLMLLSRDRLELGPDFLKLTQASLSCELQYLYHSVADRWFTVHDTPVEDPRGKTKTYLYELVFCYQDSVVSVTDCPSEPKHQEDLCQHQRHTAVKLGRVRYLQHLETLLRDGVRLIHVVRDPRSVVAHHLFEDYQHPHRKEDNFQRHLQDTWVYCNEIERDIYYLQNTFRGGQTFKDKGVYALHRYEDFEFSPVDKLIDLFRSLDIDLSATDLETLRSKRFHFENEAQKSSATWNLLTQAHLTQIEAGCRKAMDMMGYTPVKNLSKGLNHLSFVDFDVKPHHSF